MPSLSPQPTAVVAALALAVPVATENFVEGMGHAAWGHAVFVSSQLLGWTLLGLVVRSLAHRSKDGSRSQRSGSTLTLVGCLLQLAFLTCYAATVVTTGDPQNWVFLLFALGFLALTAGGFTWARALRRTPELRTARGGLLLMATLGVLAILVSVNVWHEVMLVGSYLAWILVGRGLAQSSSSSASARSSLAVGRAALGSGWRPAR